MLDQPDRDFDVPMLTLPDDLYNAVMLAEAMLIVARPALPAEPASPLGAKWAALFNRRRCLLTTGGAARLACEPAAPDAALLACMVGG